MPGRRADLIDTEVCSHESRDNGQWSSNVTEDGLDRHAAGGDFGKEKRERDCASEIGFRGYNCGVGGWIWEMSVKCKVSPWNAPPNFLVSRTGRLIKYQRRTGLQGLQAIIDTTSSAGGIHGKFKAL